MKRACVMGWPVAHSRSPALHGFWLQKYKIDGEYTAHAVPPAELAAALASLKSGEWRGCNLTIPLKEAAVGLLDDVDLAAKAIGAVNTVVVENGKLVGSNTDGFGFIENLRIGFKAFDAQRGPAVVLGAGGAARAIVYALNQAGVPEIRLLNRSVSRAENLARDMGARVMPMAWDQREAALDGATLLVNTTSLGMEKNPPLEIALARLPRDAVVNDIVYTPLETALLKAAKERGNPAVDGLGMLLHQARPGFKLWFGIAPEVTPELRAAVLAAQR